MRKEEYANIFHLENSYWWYVGLHELIQGYLEKLRRGEMTILDAGCGTGALLSIEGRYGNARGLDFSAESIRFCRERGLNNVALMDLNEWQASPNTYDAITCISVLYHAGIADDFSLIDKFYTAIKPGGYLILELPAFNCLRRPHDSVVMASRRYAKKEVGPRLLEIGFEIMTCSYRMPYLFAVIILKKFLDWITGRKNAVSDLQALPVFLNNLLLLILRCENALIARGISAPFGSSLFIVARKPVMPSAKNSSPPKARAR